jgi:tetratricopeptide (TPR) repeat protein
VRPLTLLFCFVAWSCLGATSDSILDRAVSSPEFSRELIRQYELSPNGFEGDRLLAVGIAYLGENRFADARPIYERFLNDHPDNARALRGFGSVNLFQGKTEEALVYYRNAWSKGDVDSLGSLAGIYVNLGRYGDLEKLLPDLKIHVHDDALIANCLFAFAIAKEPLDEALLLQVLGAISDKDLAVRDDTLELLFKAANRLETPELNNPTFQVILQKIIRSYMIDPKSFPKARLCGVGDAYGFLGKYSEAKSIYRQILADDPDNWVALRGLGIVDLYEHKPNEAIDKLRKAISHGDRESLVNVGAAYVLSGEVTGMKDLIPEFIRRKSENLQILNSLIAYSLKVTPPDRELFFKAIDGVPDDQILRRDDTVSLVVTGLTLFGDKEHAERLLKLKVGQDKGKKA